MVPLAGPRRNSSPAATRRNGSRVAVRFRLHQWLPIPCQGRSKSRPLRRSKREPVKELVSGVFGGERALERSGRALSPPKRVRRGGFSDRQAGPFYGGFA